MQEYGSEFINTAPRELPIYTYCFLRPFFHFLSTVLEKFLTGSSNLTVAISTLGYELWIISESAKFHHAGTDRSRDFGKISKHVSVYHLYIGRISLGKGPRQTCI